MTVDALSPARGIDPLHPLVTCFAGGVVDLRQWARDEAGARAVYRSLCAALPAAPHKPGAIGFRDPGPSFYVYHFTIGAPWAGTLVEAVYIGITRNPRLRFSSHRRARWWPRVTHALVDRIDCLYHDESVCHDHELEASARCIEAWLIDLVEPTENKVL